MGVEASDSNWLATYTPARPDRKMSRGALGSAQTTEGVRKEMRKEQDLKKNLRRGKREVNKTIKSVPSDCSSECAVDRGALLHGHWNTNGSWTRARAIDR